VAQVWVQVYSAQVAGSVAVEESALRQVEGLESVKVMVPMLVEVSEKEWDLVPTAMDLNRLEELVEVLEPRESHLKLVKE
jgi:predicted class III extradiol MEMO1 family dioxygenase